MVKSRNTSIFRGLSKESFRQAGFSIGAQKLRSFLTLLGIVIGVAPVIGLVGIMAGFNDSVAGSFARFGTSVVQFQKYNFTNGHGDDEEQRKRRDFILQDAEALARLVPLAKGVSPEASHTLTGVDGTVKNERGVEANNPNIRGVWPSYQQVRDMPVEDGRFFGEADLNHRSRTCVIGSEVAKALFPRRDPIGQRILVGNASLSIIGVLAVRGNALGGNADNVVMVPLSTWAELFPQRLTDHSGALRMALAPKDPMQQDAMIDQAITVLRARRGLRGSQPNDFHYFTAESEMKSVQKITNGIAAGVILVAAMALLVGGVGVMNIMLVSVTERTREIGIRKAMGATRRDIMAQFLLEAVALTSVGGLVGLGLGLGLAFVVRLATPLPAHAPLWSAALGFGVSAAVGLTFGLWPALKAARQDPIEALRYE